MVLERGIVATVFLAGVAHACGGKTTRGGLPLSEGCESLSASADGAQALVALRLERRRGVLGAWEVIRPPGATTERGLEWGLGVDEAPRTTSGEDTRVAGEVMAEGEGEFRVDLCFAAPSFSVRARSAPRLSTDPLAPQAMVADFQLSSEEENVRAECTAAVDVVTPGAIGIAELMCEPDQAELGLLRVAVLFENCAR